MGSNGRSIPHGPTNVSAFGLHLTLAPGTGGGCVHSGPFTNYTLNLGPVAFEPKAGDNGLGYNPRCLSRDISPFWSNNTKPTDVARLINSCDDLGCFDTNIEGDDGVHTAGHFIVGGIHIDAWASPGDPVFYLHHAQIDRAWTIWQNRNAKNRTRQVYGTSTAFNGQFHLYVFRSSELYKLISRTLLVPPSPNVTLNTTVDFGILGAERSIGNLVSTIDGPFCYMYI